MTDEHHAPTMTVEEAGVLLGISRRYAYRAASSGDIATIRIGRRILVPTALLYRMLGIYPAHGSKVDGPPQAVSAEREESRCGHLPNDVGGGARDQ